MSYRRFIAPLLVAFLSLPAVTFADKAADQDSKAQDRAFRQVQRSALAQMKSKKAEQHALAFEKLKEFPTLECAKLLVQKGLASQYDDVRMKAYSTLVSFRDSSEVCDYLLSTVEKDSAKGMPLEKQMDLHDVQKTCAIFSVPLSSEQPEIEKKAFAIFDKAAGQRKGGLLLLVSLADLLSTLADDTSVSILLKMSQRPAFDEHFGVRRSIVQALIKIEEKEAIDALIAILGKAKGEVRGDIVQHLTAVSGQQFGLDPPAWASWWKANQEKFRFLPLGARAVNRAEAVRSQSMYYGLPIYAAKVVFVLDTSHSMRGERIYAAKRELTSAISALPEGVYFDVLAFDHSVRYWQRQLLVASPENKTKATRWVEGQALGRATASYDALEAALDLNTESIFFLTDGAPHGGKIVAPEEIIEVLTRLNFTRRVTINAIGIGVGLPLPTNPFHAFLSSLAERNYGEYRPVNE